MNNSILVPTDFSEAADKALEHAIIMGNKSGAKIILLNICSSDSQINDAYEKLALQIKKVKTECMIEPLVRIGAFTDIPEISKEFDLDIIFLGTHGPQGMQKITGSHALKIVSKSETPCIIVQKDSPTPSSYGKLLATTSFHFETKQKIQAVGIIAKQFNSEVCLIYNDVDPIMKAKSLKNVQFMKQHLDKEGVRCSVETSTNKDYNADTIALGAEINANLIAIMNMQKDDVLGSGLLGNNYEQELIMNKAKIPVLILNPNNKKVFGTTTGGFH